MKFVVMAAIAASLMVVAPTIQNDPDGQVPWWQQLAVYLKLGG